MLPNILIPAALAALAGCAAAPTPGSSKLASQAQKNSVIAWAAACQSFDQAEEGIATAITAHKIPATSFKTIETISQSITPLCTTYPANTAAAITQITIAVTQLTALINGGQKP